MKKVYSVFAFLLTLCVLLGGCSTTKVNPADFAIYSDKNYIEKGVVSYFFNTAYLSFIKQYESELEAIGLDTDSPLNEQPCDYDEDSSTWYDYFLNTAVETVQNGVILKETYKGIDEKSIKDTVRQNVDGIDILAKNESLTVEKYLNEKYGKDVTLDVIKKAFELEAYTKAAYKDFKSKLDLSDKTVESYYEGHKKSYCYVDYLCFTVPGPQSQDQSEAYKIRSFADKLSEQKNEKDFKEHVAQYVKEYYAKENSELQEAEINKQVESVLDSLNYNDVPYTNDSFGNWAFDDKREIGDGIVLLNPEDSGYFVYVLISLPKRNERPITSFRQIQIDITDTFTAKDAEKKLKELQKELEDDNFSESSFISFAASYSTDQKTKDSGGLYKDTAFGTLNNKDVEKWVFDKSRKVGDYSIVKSKSSYHLLYISDIGDAAWKDVVKTGYTDSRFQTLIEESGDNCVIHLNSNLLSQIDVVNA